MSTSPLARVAAGSSHADTRTSPADANARAAGFTSYRAYLASDSWRCGKARLDALRIACGRCRICNAGRGIPLEVHHRTYESLGVERPGDVIAVCRPCHEVVTDMIRCRPAPVWERLVLTLVHGQRSAACLPAGLGT